MPADLWHVTAFTIAAALGATVLMLPPGIALAWLLARRRFPGKAIVDTLTSLPLVMPPVATGFILLYLFGRRGPIGAMLERWGIEVVFTWKAVVVAMTVMGLPLLVRTARTGFEQVRPRYEQMAATLGASPARVFFTITLPLASRAVLAGALLAFSRALGEFGATILLAGNIPGRTRTLALAIFNEAEVGRDDRAAILLGVSVVIAFAAMAASNALIHRTPDEART
jgi:molybdate transport system permease protein